MPQLITLSVTHRRQVDSLHSSHLLLIYAMFYVEKEILCGIRKGIWSLKLVGQGKNATDL